MGIQTGVIKLFMIAYMAIFLSNSQLFATDESLQVEIVPADEKLLVEVKIKPSDIASICLGQDAIVKFPAHNFAIYGGLHAEVVNISQDIITEENETYYIVTVETDQNYISRNGKHLKIIPGMMADVDILTGKKSILDYILKPILKITQYTFPER